jgi:hypothetical protein
MAPASPHFLAASPGQLKSGADIMNLSSRRFLIAQNDLLYRLADATFIRMPRNPGSHAVPALAGQRVRMASLIVELVGGVPVRVVRRTFATLSFDEDGDMDSGMFLRQQWALAESTLDPALASTKHEEKVLDAATRFIAQGGRWRPSASLARTINEAALGQGDRPRLVRTHRVAETEADARTGRGSMPDQYDDRGSR